MLWVARAEAPDGKGGINCHQKNPRSSATGCFQIIKGTWALFKCPGDVWDEDDNIACARLIYDDSGLSPWSESKPSWGRHLTVK